MSEQNKESKGATKDDTDQKKVKFDEDDKTQQKSDDKDRTAEKDKNAEKDKTETDDEGRYSRASRASATSRTQSGRYSRASRASSSSRTQSGTFGSDRNSTGHVNDNKADKVTTDESDLDNNTFKYVTDDEKVASNQRIVDDSLAQTSTTNCEGTSNRNEHGADVGDDESPTKDTIKSSNDQHDTDSEVKTVLGADKVVVPTDTSKRDVTNEQHTQTTNDDSNDMSQTQSSSTYKIEPKYSLNSRTSGYSQITDSKNDDNVKNTSNTYVTDDEKLNQINVEATDTGSQRSNQERRNSKQSLNNDGSLNDDMYIDDFDDFVQDNDKATNDSGQKQDESMQKTNDEKEKDRQSETTAKETSGQSDTKEKVNEDQNNLEKKSEDQKSQEQEKKSEDQKCQEKEKKSEDQKNQADTTSSRTSVSPHQRKTSRNTNGNGGYTITTKYVKPNPERVYAQKSSAGSTKDTNRNASQRRTAQSARYTHEKGTRQWSRDAGATSRASSRVSSRPTPPPRRARTALGIVSEDRRRKEKEFFYAELQRLKDSLRKESKKIKKKEPREHHPYVFTNLAPYYNTYTAHYLINMPDLGYKEKQHPEAKKCTAEDEEHRDLMYTTRCTAIGLCDPEESLSMDKSVLPKLETAELKKKRMQLTSSQGPKSSGGSDEKDNAAGKREKRPEAKQGSTRLPKFPVIQPPNSDLSKRELSYGDVPLLRDELYRSFSHNGQGRVKEDYKRTREDFFRMELDRVDQYHEINRPHMRRTVFAYLQNTPGAKKAVYECMKEIQKKEKEETQPQAVA